MSFPARFSRLAWLSLAIVVLIPTVGHLQSLHAQERQSLSDTERIVLEKLQRGEGAYLNDRLYNRVSARFLSELIANRDSRFSFPAGIDINGVTVTGDLVVIGTHVPFDVRLSNCNFDGSVDLEASNFAKSLNLSSASFQYSTVDFTNLKVDGDLIIDDSYFYRGAVLDHLNVGGGMYATNCEFDKTFRFGHARVETCDLTHSMFRDGLADFSHSRFGDLFLNGCSFQSLNKISLDDVTADTVSLENVHSEQATQVSNVRLNVKALRPMDFSQLSFLFSSYDPEFFKTAEDVFRAHGYSDEADKVYIAKRRAERRKKCPTWRHCSYGTWSLSMFEDLLVGYGKSLQNLLYWSLGFFILGVFVFRSEKGMRTKGWNEKSQYAGKYNPFWYSLDLFLPIIKLGEADVWTPRDNRRWANLYKKIHIIIGSLFVPIGLAALTGIIK